MTSVMLGDRILADRPHPKMGYGGCLGLSKQDVSYLVRKYMTEFYHCQQKIKHLTQQIRNVATIW
jgi:hypothetical protein